MADNQLTATTSSGQQTTTQNPQTATAQTDNAAAQAQAVQPGTATSLLNSQQGLTLAPGALTTVDLTATTTQATPKPVVPPTKHINAGLLGISAVLVVVAIVLFWWTGHSAKSTTLSS